MTLPTRDCMVAVRVTQDGIWIPGLFMCSTGHFYVSGYAYLLPSEIHSYRLLTFADEAAKHIEEAHLEGWLNCWRSLCNEDTGHLAHWNTSHAKQQAEGLTK